MEPSLKYKTCNHIDNSLGWFDWIRECCRGKGRPAILLGTNAQRTYHVLYLNSTLKDTPTNKRNSLHFAVGDVRELGEPGRRVGEGSHLGGEEHVVVHRLTHTMTLHSMT